LHPRHIDPKNDEVVGYRIEPNRMTPGEFPKRAW
jgi:hypothetical protein